MELCILRRFAASLQQFSRRTSALSCMLLNKVGHQEATRRTRVGPARGAAALQYYLRSSIPCWRDALIAARARPALHNETKKTRNALHFRKARTCHRDISRPIFFHTIHLLRPCCQQAYAQHKRHSANATPDLQTPDRFTLFSTSAKAHARCHFESFSHRCWRNLRHRGVDKN